MIDPIKEKLISSIIFYKNRVGFNIEQGFHTPCCHCVCTGGCDDVFANGEADGQSFSSPNLTVNTACPDDAIGKISGEGKGYSFKEDREVRWIKILAVSGYPDEYLG